MSSKLYNKDINQLRGTFATLAHEPRLAILGLLKEKGEKSVGQIADHLELSYKVVSKHLLVLFDRGVLSRRYDGPFVQYKISSHASRGFHIIINELL